MRILRAEAAATQWKIPMKFGTIMSLNNNRNLNFWIDFSSKQKKNFTYL